MALLGFRNILLLADAIFANEKTRTIELLTFKSNDLSQTFFCIPDASLLITG